MLRKIMQAYVSFSIHGTNCFISAKKEMTASEITFKSGQADWSLATSRRKSFKSDGEVKFHWNKLNTKAGKPYISPIWILRRFKELEEMGWSVDKENFVKKHFGKK